jgi:hypothetical protein
VAQLCHVLPAFLGKLDVAEKLAGIAWCAQSNAELLEQIASILCGVHVLATFALA